MTSALTVVVQVLQPAYVQFTTWNLLTHKNLTPQPGNLPFCTHVLNLIFCNDKKGHSLDPATLRARDDARAHHSFERTQFMTLSSQLDGLRSQISALQQENNDLKRERDRAEMERTWAARFDEVVACGRSHDRRGRSRSPSYPPSW
jgi:hypothetical protein